MTSHTRKWKEVKKQELEALIRQHKVIAIATLNKLPANIVSILRKRLKGKAELRVAKVRVLQKALKDSKLNVAKLDPYVKENVLIIFSKINPFELFSFVKKNKGARLAVEGDIAESDILVQAGDTGLPPGPALSTLKAAGLSVKVAGPTISIVADKVVVKKGEVIKREIADVLGKLGIKPIKVGMNIISIIDLNEDQLYTADSLDVDEDELFNKFVLAHQQAMNLLINSEIFIPESAEMILIKAERDARAVKSMVDSAEKEKNSV